MRYLIFALFLLFIYSCNEVSTSDNLSLNSDEIVSFNNGQTGENCSTEIDTISSSMTVQGTTIGFSDSFLAPPTCSDSYSPDKVYKIVVTDTKKFTAEIVNSNLDSVLYLKRACEIDAIMCNDDISASIYQSRISGILEAGEYFLVVDGYGRSSSGAFDLKIDLDSAVGESCTGLLCQDGFSCEIESNTPTCVCNSGNCGTTNELASKDIIISEFMANPAGSDRYNEWLELKNNTNRDIEIKSLKITKDNTSYNLNTSNLTIKANDYFVIVKSPNTYLSEYDAVISSLSLTNSGTHTLKLTVNDVKVDEMTYTSASSGISFQYSNEWCNSRSAISENNLDKGTPGIENLDCGDVCDHNCSNHGVCDEVSGSCECETGYTGSTCNDCETGYEIDGNNCKEILSQLLNERDIIITEFMPNPVGSDTTGEWLEIYNRTSEDLSLDGLKIIRDTTSYSLSTGYTINANSYFLIGKSSSAADGNVDAVISSMSFTNTSEHTVTLELGDLTLDTVTYNGSVEGESKQVDVNKYDDDFDINNWCDSEISPKSQNLSCNAVDFCENVNCNNGECIADETSYLCICELGFTGNNCETCDPNNPDCSKTPEVNDLVITELMINPDGSDSDGEWIEIYNSTSSKLKLDNLKIKKDSIVYNVNLINTTINQKSYYLIARNTNIAGTDATSTFSLNNTGSHSITILVNGVEIDTITYDSSKSAISYQLDRAFDSATINDNANYWCDGTSKITEEGNDMGTPRSQNRPCGPCALLECQLNSVCVSVGDTASCECNTGYRLNDDNLCVMNTSCGVLYDGVRNLEGAELRAALQQLTGQKYNAVEYNVSRKIMYREIDIDENSEVQCVYTGRKMNVTEGEELDSRYGGCSINTCSCTNPGMNTEHTWPQSKFDKQEPMKGDVHHLFPTDGCTNGRRSSFPFGTVTSAQGTFGDYPEYGQSKLGTNSEGKIVFEPADIHKGDIARAMFYFVTRYSNYSNFLSDTQEATLRAWAAADPVSEKEQIRNTKIEQLQWNRNPFVDCPEFLDKISNF